ncbi:ABC transporter transmembrane domain-containing protein [Caulobacter sp. B11]|uniref:ABC transporter transmembrane domain-containing protein n=1 Tax=Caulobacter sp. B11 TaxID=2048899 RepID=UPI00137472A7|nr:ABC transporter transmembrane domain-containing protein [Caulobacter sp. B11]
MQSALKAARGPLAFTALFSLASNLLYLSLPIYTQQIYGRVLISQSLGTLLVLTVGILVVFCVSAVLDYLRSQVMVNFSLEFDRQVSGPAFTTLFDAVVQRDRTTRSQALRDIDAVRQLLSGPAVATLFDLPWMPVFIFILFVIDPVIGFVTLGGGVVLVALTVAQNYFTRDKLRAASDEAIKGYAFTDAALRNGEVVRAMGMLPHLAAPWGKHRETALELSTVAQERGAMFSHATKLVRMIIQILIIAVGAALVIEQKIPSTMLFANMILASRALMPIQGLVGSFGPLTNGLQALARLNLLLGSYQPPERRTALPKPKGHIVVDRLSYAAPGSDVLILKAISLELAPARFWASPGLRVRASPPWRG